MLGLEKIPSDTHQILTNSMKSVTDKSFSPLSIPIRMEYHKNKQKLQGLQRTLMADNKETIVNSKNYIASLIEQSERGKSLDQVLQDPDFLAKGPSTLLAEYYPGKQFNYY